MNKGNRRWERMKKSGGVPAWAWYITWGIMALGVLLNLIVLLMKLQIVPTPVLR